LRPAPIRRAISGAIAPTAGTVRWQSTDISGRSPEEIVSLGIAHVPEGRRLFAGLTVRENPIIGAYSRRDGARDIERMVHLFPLLGERLDQLAASLSNGEQQMCAIARGLMARPKVLMIDELASRPSSWINWSRSPGDPEDGTSVLLVEQDVDAALRLAQRAYVMETCRSVAEGTGEQLLNDPRVREAYLGVA
jgi:branched-chain amino acid transport system ATP-binding protein